MRTVWAMIIAAGMAATVSQTTWAQEAGAGKARAGGHRPERGEAGQRFKDMDANGDGKVTWDEFKAFHESKLRTRFDTLDTNKDGVLSREDRPARGAGADAPAAPANP